MLPTTGNVIFLDMDFGLGRVFSEPPSRLNLNAQWDGAELTNTELHAVIIVSRSAAMIQAVVHIAPP
jgi:hypothetical protein